MKSHATIVAFPLALLAILCLSNVSSGFSITRRNRVVGLRNLEDARQSHAFCNVRGKLAALGGRGPAKTAYFYNGQSGRWEDFGRLPFNRSGIHHVQCSAYRNGLILAGGFMDDFPFERPARDILYWNLKTGTFNVIGKIPQNRARGSAAIVVRRGLIYIFGGNSFGHGQGLTTSKKWCDRFNPDNNAWRRLRDTSRRRDHAGAVYDAARDRAYLAGGRNGGASMYWLPRFAYSVVEVYSFRQNRWTNLNQRTASVHPGSTPTLCGSLLVIAGGEVSRATGIKAVDQSEVYNLRRRQWVLRSGSTSSIAKFADRHGSPLVHCRGAIYRVAGAQRDPNGRRGTQNVEKRQFQALLLDGTLRKCTPDSFWRGIRPRKLRVGTADFFRRAGQTPPPMTTSAPIEGTMTPEIPGLGQGKEPVQEPVQKPVQEPVQKPAVQKPV